MLGPFVDEIELLLFESAPVKDLLPGGVLDDLRQLSVEHQVTYNIHLPTDISITDPAGTGRRRAVETLVNIIERVEELSPTSYTLHLPYAGDVGSAHQLRKWSDRVTRNLEKLVRSGAPANRIAIETIDYPIPIIADVIDELNFGICMDVGHLLLQGHDIISFYQLYRRQISIIHLHGVRGLRDHVSLEHLPVELLESFLGLLHEYRGTISLEVFSFDILSTSLGCLAKCWQSISTTSRPCS
jgi:sugar phosphate isomerase/epimerase